MCGGLIFLCGAYTVVHGTNAKSSEAYFVADRKTPLFALVATLVMTELNTSTLLGFASMGYIFGPSAILLGCVFLVGLLFYALTVAKQWKRFDGVTVTAYFSQRYNPIVGYFAAVILFISMLGFSANFLKSLTVVFSPLFPHLDPWVLSGIFCLLMMGITLRGGMRSIIRVDVVSFFLVIILFSAGAIIHIGERLPLDISFGQKGDFPIHLAVSLSIITIFTYILAPWYGQKIFSANSERTAYLAVVISAVIVSLVYVLGILAAAGVSGEILAHEALPHAIHHHLPVSLQGGVYATLFFIAATTLVGLWNTMASVIIAHHPQSLAKTPLPQSVIFTGLIALGSYVGSNLFVDQVLQKLILCNIPIAALAFSLLAGFYWSHATSQASFASIVTGTIGGIGCYVYFGDQDYLWYWSCYVIPAHFIVGVITTLLTRKATLALS